MSADSNTPRSDAHWTPPTAGYDAGYGAGLGELYANLVTLEFALRVTLCLYATPQAQRRLPSFKIANLDSWQSSWSSLSDAIEAYNKMQAKEGRPQIDAEITDLRNSVAHERISGGSFGDPISVTWIRAQSDRVSSAVRAVHEQMRELEE
jgi:hypothetical protein